MHHDLVKPILLKNNNFTPMSRTPWAGNYINKHIKNHSISPQHENIGESWEVSLDPDFPSVADEYGCTLKTLFQDHKDQLDPKGLELLIKIIHSQIPLSVQLHPNHNHPGLKLHECGKPESWLVLNCKPGSGVYLGFKEILSQEKLQQLLATDAIEKYLNFIPVSKGDYFEIPPHTVHALGPHVAVLEPQHLFPDYSGKTLRLWDWGRAPGGVKRPLHIKEALELIEFEAQTPEQIAKNCIKKPVPQNKHDHSLIHYPDNSFYQVSKSVFTDQSYQIQIKQGLSIVTVVSGELNLSNTHSNWTIPKGFSAILPYRSFPYGNVQANSPTCEAYFTTPSGNHLRWIE